MKKWSAILACLLLAAGIWLMMTLSRTHSNLETVSVIACSSLEGLSEMSAEPVDITARCKASGFELIQLKLSDKAVELRISPEDFTLLPDGRYAVGKDRMSKYAHEIFGSGVSVEAFAAENFKFRFEKEEFKKVPVLALSYINFHSQYTSTGPLSFSPDSVAVYGEPDRLKEISAAYTRPISLKNVKSTTHGIITLQIPENTRLSENEVTWELPVTRYVDIKERIEINVINAPSYKILRLFPHTVDVTYRCSFPPTTDPRGRTRVYVDYNEFKSSITGKCMLRSEPAAGSVISVIMEPKACNCVEMSRI